MREKGDGMPVIVHDIMRLMEEIAPGSLMEAWDNIGLQLGDPSQAVSNILVTLDIDEQVAEEAIKKDIDLIISHHPLIFHPVKSLRSDRPVGRLIAKLIQNGIGVYAAHTNLDSAFEGINDFLAELMQLNNTQVLSPVYRKKL